MWEKNKKEKYEKKVKFRKVIWMRNKLQSCISCKDNADRYWISDPSEEATKKRRAKQRIISNNSY